MREKNETGVNRRAFIQNSVAATLAAGLQYQSSEADTSQGFILSSSIVPGNILKDSKALPDST
jgi:hypothetical protein